MFKIFALTLTLPRIPQTNLTQLEGFNQRKQLPLGLQQRLKMHLQAAFQADIQETDTVLAQVNRLFLYGVLRCVRCGACAVVYLSTVLCVLLTRPITLSSRSRSVPRHTSSGGVAVTELEDDMQTQMDAQGEEPNARCPSPRRARGDLHPWLRRDQQRRPVHADALGAGESLI